MAVGAAALVFLLTSAGAAVYLAYDRQRDQLAVERSARNALAKEVVDAGTAIDELRNELQGSSRRGEDVGSLDEGRGTRGRAQRSERPRRERRVQRALADFGTWELDRYYIVRLAKGTRKRQYEVTERSLMKPCTAYHFQGQTITSRSEPCG